MMILHQQALWTRTIDHVLLMVQLAKTTDLHDFDELFTLCIPVEFMIYEGEGKWITYERVISSFSVE